MASQYPNTGGAAGGRGGGGGGRGGRGGGQPQQPFMAGGRGGVGAWQPAAPSGMNPPPQAAAAAAGTAAGGQPQQQPGQQQQQPGVVPTQQQQQQQMQAAAAMYGQYPPQHYYQYPPQQHHHPHHPHHPHQHHPYGGGNPQHQQQHPHQQQQWRPGGGVPPGAGGYNPNNLQQQQQRGAVFYPPGGAAPTTPQQQAQRQQPSSVPAAVVPAARPRKMLTITDKYGNPIDLTGGAAKKAAAPSSESSASESTKAAAAPAAAVPAVTKESSEDAGAKLRKAIEEKMKMDAKKDNNGNASKEVATPSPATSSKPASATATAAAAAATTQKSEAKSSTPSVPPGLATDVKKLTLADRLQSAEAAKPAESAASTSSSRRVYSKESFMQLKFEKICMVRPASLADMTVIRAPVRQRGSQRRDEGGGGGGGGGSWARGSAPPRRQSQQNQGNNNSNNNNNNNDGGGGGGQWSRGQAPPKQQKNNDRRQSGRGRGGNNNQVPLFDGPVAPLVKSDNHWKPRTDTSALVVAEKKVKSILNKMTKEKFDRLAGQMLSVPLTSYDMLTMMINNVYDKAIDEPPFGDMYADLCRSLSRITIEFLKVIESDEEPPTEDASESAMPNNDEKNSSHHTVYRWSNNVSTTDEEILGPFESADACIDAAMEEEEREPIQRGEMVLELDKVLIRRGVFIKIMKKKEPAEGESQSFFAVFFPVQEAEECGQQLSKIFLSELECISDATKQNSFKRSLLNKCEDEFQKQDIYEGWKQDKAEYEAKKNSLSAQERAETEDELAFRRVRIKKQMLGNVKFIGQLYKKGLLKEKIMRYCIASLLNLEEDPDAPPKAAAYRDTGNTVDMDEEDHEAICSMFTTIGLTIDTLAAQDYMKVCFDKITSLSDDETLPSRSRFMYKDLLELRGNRWVPRRKEENAKTIAEIRRDVEIEERKQQQQSNWGNNNRGGGGGGGRPGGSGDARRSFTNRPRQPKPVTETDSDGFTVIGSKTGFAPAKGRKQPSQNALQGAQSSSTRSSFSALADDKKGSTKAAAPVSSVEPLDEDTLEKRIKSMRTDFMGDGGDANELLTSWSEISGTPKAGVKIIDSNCNRMMDCKEDERLAIVRMLTMLVEKGKLTKDDVRTGLLDPIEFIDSCVLDSPRAYEYLGDVIGEMMRLKAVDDAWLCEQLEKTKVDPTTEAPRKVVAATISALKKSGGSDLTKAIFASHKEMSALLGDDSWRTISAEL